MLTLLVKYLPALVSGAVMSLKLAILVWVFGLVLGIVLGTARALLPRRAKAAASIAFMAVGSVPILVYLFWFHYPLQGSLGIVVNPFVTSAIVLGAYNGIVISDLVRGAIEEFPPAYREAATVWGIKRVAFAREIMLPLLVRGFLPGYLSTQVTALHLTLFASLISVDELFKVAQRINSLEYRPVEIFSLLALFYFALSFPLLLTARWLAGRFQSYARDD